MEFGTLVIFGVKDQSVKILVDPLMASKLPAVMNRYVSGWTLNSS